MRCRALGADTFAFEAAGTSPILAITSPTKRCGKTRMLELLEGLVNRGADDLKHFRGPRCLEVIEEARSNPTDRRDRHTRWDIAAN